MDNISVIEKAGILTKGDTIRKITQGFKRLGVIGVKLLLSVRDTMLNPQKC